MSLDLYDLPNNSDKVQIFYSSGVWVKPRGVTMVYIVAIGAGAGGGGGLTKAAGLAGAGGAGGGSGAITRSLIPAILIPDNLYINVGIGGTGGGPSVAGGSGGTTTVDFVPNGDISTFLVLANGGSGGAAGLTSGVATSGGLGGVAATTATNPFIITSVYGIIGGNAAGTTGNGGSTGNGSSPIYATGGVPLTNGAGGGGIAAAGTSSTGGATGGVATFFAPTVGGSPIGNRDGENGSFSISPFYSQGGAGGGGSGNVSTNSGNGTRGGNGNIGSGGGGGGTGTSPGVAGNGGNGGNGLVVIVCY